MKRGKWLVPFALMLLITVSIVSAANPLINDELEPSTGPTNPEANLLNNPSFEGQYSAYVPPGGHPDCGAVCSTAQVASGWTPWWRPSGSSPDYAMPEYKPAELWHVPDRVQEGSRAQQYFTRWILHEAGVYQRVSASVGQQYRFRIWGHAWSSDSDNPYLSNSTLEQRIGIDPTGGTDWTSSNIVWGPWNQQYDAYGTFYVCATATSNHITVFTYAKPVWRVSHNDVYWDNAELIAFSGKCQLGLQTSPAEVDLLVEAGSQEDTVQELQIKMPYEPGITWHAELAPGGSVTPTLSANSGTLGQNLTLRFDTDNMAFGNYSAGIVINSDIDVPGNPLLVPISLSVVPEIILNLHTLPSIAGFMVDVDEPLAKEQLLKIKIPYQPGITWQAQLEAGGNLTPDLSADNGVWGEDLTITVDSHGLPVGDYSANLIISTQPNVTGNPTKVPIYLWVVPEIQSSYLSRFIQ